MSMNPVNGVETIIRVGRGLKTSSSKDDVYNHPERITDVFYTDTETFHVKRVMTRGSREVDAWWFDPC